MIVWTLMDEINEEIIGVYNSRADAVNEAKSGRHDGHIVLQSWDTDNPGKSWIDCEWAPFKEE